MLEPGSPAPALPQVGRRRFPGFRSSGALESDSPSLRLIPKASPSSPACDHLPVLSGSLSFSIAFELHLTLPVRPFTSAASPRLLRPLLTSGRNFPRQTSPGKNDHFHRMYPSHLPHTLLVPSGFELRCVLAQRAVPPMRFVFLGSRLCLRLPSDPALRRRPCLQLTVPVTKVRRGLSPPSDRPCRAHNERRAGEFRRLFCFAHGQAPPLLSPAAEVRRELVQSILPRLDHSDR